jgi:putative radical SAM enzyme (TIGR03279 family)
VASGIRISSVKHESAAYRAGLRVGDTIKTVNGGVVEHELDFAFLNSCGYSSIEVMRRKKQRVFNLTRVYGEESGLEFAKTPVKRCGNRCVFCFIDQLPRGMRPALYVKDEDCRHSFLNGNYVTMTGMSNAEIRSIAESGFSPLYVSVHSTVPEVRVAMLRNRHAGQILKQLKLLELLKIQFHAQIVLCPGINDRAVLKKTIKDLAGFRKGMLSLAVVPVGLTRFHSNGLRPVTPEDAAMVLSVVHKMSDKDFAVCGTRRIYAADEFYLKSGTPVPDAKYYGKYPQIGNGVGLIGQLIEQWKSIERKMLRRMKKTGANTSVKNRVHKKRKILVVTSTSAYPFVNRICGRLSVFSRSIIFEAVAVENRFFGPGVNVAGLLTARDIMPAVRQTGSNVEKVILPEILLNHNGSTLDGYTVERISRETGLDVAVAGDMSVLADMEVLK